MSTVTNDSSYFIEPTILDYANEVNNDSHLQILIDNLPETADTNAVELLQFQIDKVKLVFCNFTKNTLRVDNLRNLYMNDMWQGLYTPDDCHTVFYHLKKDNSFHWSEVRRLEKDDHSDKITYCAFGQTADDHWMRLPIPMG